MPIEEEKEIVSQATEPPDGQVLTQQEMKSMQFNRRYVKTDEVLGKGAFKTVYKGFDTYEGIEVAWNHVRLSDLIHNQHERERLLSEIRVLKKLKHNNIMNFHDYWVNEVDQTVSFITELFTSGTLRQYRRKHKKLEVGVLKRWAWQILQGLVYLHGMNPPIMHRDLKCDNIFVNGCSGQVKIGDLGLATLLRKCQQPQSVLGTPEFMAPEMYDEVYDTKVDVYAFGMCLLELATRQYPYSECQNAAQIYKKVVQGTKPNSLKLVEDVELREFIELCITRNHGLRPESRQLLKHSFFDDVKLEIQQQKLADKQKYLEDLRKQNAPSMGDCKQNVSRAGQGNETYTETGQQCSEGFVGQDYIERSHQQGSPVQSTNAASMYHYPATGNQAQSGINGDEEDDTEFKIKVSMQESTDVTNTVNFAVKIYHQNAPTIIEFSFDLEHDTAESISLEMMAELQITQYQAEIIAEHMRTQVQRILPTQPSNAATEMQVQVNQSETEFADGLKSGHNLDLKSSENKSIHVEMGSTKTVNPSGGENISYIAQPGNDNTPVSPLPSADAGHSDACLVCGLRPTDDQPLVSAEDGGEGVESGPQLPFGHSAFQYSLPPHMSSIVHGYNGTMMFTQQGGSGAIEGSYGEMVRSKQEMLVMQSIEASESKVDQLHGYLQDALNQQKQGGLKESGQKLDESARSRLAVLQERANAGSSRCSAEASSALNQVSFADVQNFMANLYSEMDRKALANARAHLSIQPVPQACSNIAYSEVSTGGGPHVESPSGMITPKDGRSTPLYGSQPVLEVCSTKSLHTGCNGQPRGMSCLGSYQPDISAKSLATPAGLPAVERMYSDCLPVTHNPPCSDVAAQVGPIPNKSQAPTGFGPDGLIDWSVVGTGVHPHVV